MIQIKIEGGDQDTGDGQEDEGDGQEVVQESGLFGQ